MYSYVQQASGLCWFSVELVMQEAAAWWVRAGRFGFLFAPLRVCWHEAVLVCSWGQQSRAPGTHSKLCEMSTWASNLADSVGGMVQITQYGMIINLYGYITVRITIGMRTRDTCFLSRVVSREGVSCGTDTAASFAFLARAVRSSCVMDAWPGTCSAQYVFLRLCLSRWLTHDQRAGLQA